MNFGCSLIKPRLNNVYPVFYLQNKLKKNEMSQKDFIINSEFSLAKY